jgi:hypothetical protein
MDEDFTKYKKNRPKRAIKNNKKISAANCYRYEPKLEEYLIETLRLQNAEEENSKEPGNKISNKHKREKVKNQNVKVDVLDKIIFPSMANLIYLFEYMNKHHELDKILNKDIDELLGLKGLHWKAHYNADERKKYYAFQRMMFSLLSYQNKNTRLAILNTIGLEIISQLINLGTEKERLIGNKVINQDLGRALVWIRYITSGITVNNDRAHRPITF